MLRLFKSVLLAFFVCTGVYGSGPVEDVLETFGEFKDLHKPFVDPRFHQYSPVHGPLDLVLIESLLFSGHTGLHNIGLPRPQRRKVDEVSCTPDSFPQDAAAAIIERLFPSFIGFLANANMDDDIHKWLRPVNLALIFNAIESPDFFKMTKAEAGLILAEAMQPQLFQQARAYKKKNPKGTRQFPIKSLPFAELLFEGFSENLGDKATANGYPPHVVERTLLTFVWEKKKLKNDLRPFYEALSGDIIDKKKVAEIIWQGEGSCFTAADYWAARKSRDKDNLETRALLKLGYSVFEDRFPPIIQYGVAKIEIDGQNFFYSDCGNNSLRNFFMQMLYNFDLQRYEWERLERLKAKGFKVNEKFINYFRNICKKPAQANKPWARNEWGKVLYNLNEGILDEEDKVKFYHPTVENGTFGICAGLPNMLKVIKLLLGDPRWNKASHVYRSPTNRKLTRLCKIFDPQGKWDWEIPLKPEERTGGFADIVNHTILDENDVRLVFSKEGIKIFEWHMQPLHYDFVSSSRSKSIPYHPPGAVDKLKAESSVAWPADVTEASFPELLFNCYLDSISGKIRALYRILQFKQTFRKSTYDYLITKWIEPTGKYFAGWTDFHTNSSLLEVLHQFADKSDVCERVLKLKAPRLRAHMLKEYAEYCVELEKDIVVLTKRRVGSERKHNYISFFDKETGGMRCDVDQPESMGWIIHMSHMNRTHVVLTLKEYEDNTAIHMLNRDTINNAKIYRPIRPIDFSSGYKIESDFRDNQTIYSIYNSREAALLSGNGRILSKPKMVGDILFYQPDTSSFSAIDLPNRKALYLINISNESNTIPLIMTDGSETCVLLRLGNGFSCVDYNPVTRAVTESEILVVEKSYQYDFAFDAKRKRLWGVNVDQTVKCWDLQSASEIFKYSLGPMPAGISSMRKIYGIGPDGAPIIGEKIPGLLAIFSSNLPIPRHHIDHT